MVDSHEHIDDGMEELRPWNGRAVLLVDLDAFFASVEQLDHPDWRGKPVIVGGSPDKRGVVSTASYEARVYGVHSAMPSWQAARLCPNAIWTHGNYPRYKEMSNKVMDIIRDETPALQQVSIDEAFADVTPGRHIGDHPVVIARRIRARVAELGITCSVGVGTTKTIAKIASDLDKPDGLTAVYPGDERSFLDPLPAGKISGIGGKTVEKLEMYGIRTIGDLAVADERLLHSIFGKNAETMIKRARGEEDARVEQRAPVKSVSNEQTFAKDLETRDEIVAAIDMLAAKVGRRLRHKGLAGHTITLKARYHDLTIRTAQKTLDTPVDDERQMMPVLHKLVDEVWAPGAGLRLVGVGVSEFGKRAEQLSLFDANEANTAEDAVDPGEHGSMAPEESSRLAWATDAVKDRFGEKAVRFGRELRFDGRDTGTMAQQKDVADLADSPS
ncbi:MAG: DNA polymerase IV [Coriobacteriales bacterium]|jgi:DNA polymerase-4